MSKLLGFQLEIVYRTGKSNSAADALSRLEPTAELLVLLSTQTIDLERVKEELKQDQKLQRILQSLQQAKEVPEAWSSVNGALLHKGHLVLS